MPRKIHISSLKRMGEINLTPLMDLTFILLITFIITFPLIEHGIEINVPTGTANELTEENTCTVSMDGKGNIYLDDFPLNPGELRKAIVDLGRSSPGITVMVRADEKIDYGEVVKILKILHDAKISSMALVTQAEER